MSRKRKTVNRPKRIWGEWREATPIDRITGEPATLEAGERFFTNGLYNVHMTSLERTGDNTPPMTWLSICRIDRKPLHDWRDMQRIKNELVGPECEGVELFPAESRLVDTANQYHLWVIADPDVRFPFGFEERYVTTPKETSALATSAVQRAFDDA